MKVSYHCIIPVLASVLAVTSCEDKRVEDMPLTVRPVRPQPVTQVSPPVASSDVLQNGEDASNPEDATSMGDPSASDHAPRTLGDIAAGAIGSGSSSGGMAPSHGTTSVPPAPLIKSVEDTSSLPTAYIDPMNQDLVINPYDPTKKLRRTSGGKPIKSGTVVKDGRTGKKFIMP